MKSKTLRKQEEAALSKGRFRLVATTSELKRDLPIPQGNPRPHHFLNYIYADGIEKIKPESVNIIQ